ncbi:MAG: LptF/LptG family permease [Alphaproteobacteria bacterium]|nr:LptF/LptG family permease [Alphaproteobacteria bacterium]
MATSRILNRFLSRRFFSGVGLVVLVVCGIIFAVTFVERLPSNPTAVATLMDSWTRLLEYIPMFLPLTVFMGTLVAAYNLTKSSEMIIMSGAGLSTYQTARPILLGAALIGIFATTVLNPYSVKLSTRNITSDKLQLVAGSIWLREESDNGYITLISKGMQRAGNNDLIFTDSTIYIQNKDFKLQQRIYADAVTLSDFGLSSDSVKSWNKNGKMTKTKWSKETKINPQTVLDRYLQPDQISFWQLPKFIHKMESIGIPVRGHWVQFWTLLFLPLTMISMAVLGVAFSQTKQRRNYTFGVKFALGIVTCFAVYFLISLFNALGASGALPPILAIIAPPLIIIAGAGTFIAGFDTM